ncbi:MAG: hypothetical protein OEZ06_30925 [Myxococcales bacterium]|nr:hypothetical protein [Myxococcales bacterium]
MLQSPPDSDSPDPEERERRKQLFRKYVVAWPVIPVVAVAASALLRPPFPCGRVESMFLIAGLAGPILVFARGIVVFARERSRVRVLAGLLVAWSAFVVEGFVGFHYPRIIENDPFRNPVRVASVEGTTLTLEDGRRLRLETTRDADLYHRVKASEFFVEVEDFGEESYVAVKERMWLCGTPWAYMIRIPLIADDVPINRLVPLGFAWVVGAAK